MDCSKVVVIFLLEVLTGAAPLYLILPVNVMPGAMQAKVGEYRVLSPVQGANWTDAIAFNFK